MKSPIDTVNTIRWSENEYRHMGMWGNWCVLRDIANSLKYGFSQYRLPKPGQAIDVGKAQDRAKKIEENWQKESMRRVDYPGQKAPKFNTLPTEAKCYLHSVLTSRVTYQQALDVRSYLDE